jgi:NADH:ubiquinone oxidoreductase subunit 5 (subunit L)/multisubunit Na+/H+ antiporter MnhA subunit
MILICGLASVSVSLFHLFNHAFFKAVLFIGAGSIIHAASDEQDMRKYGSISMLTPFLCIVFYTASMALTGLPFLSGFYSKDAILEILVANNSNLLCLWGY